MSDNVVKLRIDSKEYDAKLKNAGRALSDYIEKVREGGGTLKFLDDGVMEALQSLGAMATKADGTRGSLREMTQTITDLTVQYRALSDEEKNTDFGKELNKSILELTERAGNLRDAMGDVEASVTNAASDTRAFDQLAQGVSVVMAGIQGLTGTFKLLGINMGDNVEVIARLQAAMAVTNSLTTIQNALQKQSALMQGVMAVQAKAAAAAQTLLAANMGKATVAQRLFNTVAKMNPYVLLATGAAVLVTSLVSLTRKEDEQVKKAEEARKAAEDLKNEWNKISNNTVGSLYGKFITLQASWEKLQTVGEKTQWIKNNASAFNELGVSIKSISNAEDVFVNNTGKMIKSIELRARAAVLQKQLEKSLENGIKDENGLYTLGYAVSQNIAKELADIQSELQGLMGTASVAIGGGGGGGKNNSQEAIPPAYSIAGLTAQMQALRKEQEQVTSTSDWVEYQRRIFGVTDAMKMLRGELSPQGLGAVSFSDMGRKSVEAAQQSLKDKKLDVKIVQPPKEEKADVKASEILGSISSAVSNMVSGIEGLGIKIPEDMKNMLGALNSITMILTSIEAFQKVGALLGIFAHGGIVKAASGYTVPGRRFSGDMIPARLNAGELVLNQAQAGIIASALQDRDFSGGMGGQPYTNGENIILGINNTYKRKGMGEIVTTSMLRHIGLTN